MSGVRCSKDVFGGSVGVDAVGMCVGHSTTSSQRLANLLWTTRAHEIPASIQQYQAYSSGTAVCRTKLNAFITGNPFWGKNYSELV